MPKQVIQRWMVVGARGERAPHQSDAAESGDVECEKLIVRQRLPLRAQRTAGKRTRATSDACFHHGIRLSAESSADARNAHADRRSGALTTIDSDYRMLSKVWGQVSNRKRVRRDGDAGAEGRISPDRAQNCRFASMGPRVQLI